MSRIVLTFQHLTFNISFSFFLSIYIVNDSKFYYSAFVERNSVGFNELNLI